ncbi:PadR family transcriptional regulator [Anaerosporobacter sp.]|uniref:PadR family transcriptional regulator n=1 Tax=Anaerosporobacter sp. TaxID=1872529 RepID=UPI00286EC009|nr:PadR family transcriptional regulator [Anaerosporobacter sp.]
MTQLIVLGMLEIQPMSGYDIQTTLQELNAEMWSGVLVGSIYHALKKLEKDGYIEIDSIEQTGLRQKATYKIAEKGKSFLKELILDSLTKPSSNFPTTLYSAITFIDKVPKEEARTALLKQRDFLQNQLDELDKGLKEKNEALGNHLPPIVASSFKNMFGITRLQKEYIEELLEII